MELVLGAEPRSPWELRQVCSHSAELEELSAELRPPTAADARQRLRRESQSVAQAWVLRALALVAQPSVSPVRQALLFSLRLAAVAPAV